MARFATLLWAVPTTLAVLMLAKAALQPDPARAPSGRFASAVVERLAPPGRLHFPSDARPVPATASPVPLITQKMIPPPSSEPNVPANDVGPTAAADVWGPKAQELAQSANAKEEQNQPPDVLYPIADDSAPPELADAWPIRSDRRATDERLPKLDLQPPAGQMAAPASRMATSPARDQAMAAVRQQVSAANQKSIKLAQRGALYSARAELLDALRLLAQAQDAQDGTSQRVAALSAALNAMEESDDFTPQAVPESVALTDVIRPHQTPVLKSIDVTRLSHLTCSQHYYAYAQQQLNVAAGRDPVAAQSLYLLGKVHSHLASQTANIRSAHTARAMVFHQATLAIDPRHHQAANELGVLLARFGELSAARQMLLASVTSHATPSAWHNLASVHERLGETDLAGRARHEAQLMTGKTPATGVGQSVQWVDAATFASQSPADPAIAARGNSRPVAASTATQPRPSVMRR